MSYTIEYDRVFLKSNEGFTALWLHGDNNVYEPLYNTRGPREKRARDWGIMSDFLGVSEEYMLKQFEGYFNNYDEHWKKNGKFLTNKQTINWVKTGCRNAVTVEELIEANKYLDIETSLWDWDNLYQDELKRKIRTTEDLDRFISDYRAFVKEHQSEKIKGRVYPHINFYPMEFKKPKNYEDYGYDKVFLTNKKWYVREILDNSFSWTKDRSDALQLDISDAKAVLEQFSRYKLRIVKVTNDPYNAVVKADYNGVELYVESRVRGKVYFTYDIKRAHYFRTKKEADAFVKRNEHLFKCKMWVEIDNSK